MMLHEAVRLLQQKKCIHIWRPEMRVFAWLKRGRVVFTYFGTDDPMTREFADWWDAGPDIDDVLADDWQPYDTCDFEPWPWPWPTFQAEKEAWE